MKKGSKGGAKGNTSPIDQMAEHKLMLVDLLMDEDSNMVIVSET
ncbi:Uncharacterized protein APZ42_001914 [Daphnia magna]|uniref:Uncharacterized protein n=1 Tax=Daphnia magna TaxID=35525 RepID=A0A164IN42_9CRUS|nr:Uncharacterized protein APZ42_001914 [Daphnia magna]